MDTFTPTAALRQQMDALEEALAHLARQLGQLELLEPPNMRFVRIMAGSSSVSQRKPMESLPCVTSISSVTSRGWEGAANRRGVWLLRQS